MSSDNEDSTKATLANELIDALCDGNLTPEMAAELDRLVLNDREIRLHYIRTMHLQAGLYQHAPIVAGATEPEEEHQAEPNLDDTMVLPSLIAGEYRDESPEELPALRWIGPREVSPFKELVRRWSWAALIAIFIGAGLFASRSRLFHGSVPAIKNAADNNMALVPSPAPEPSATQPIVPIMATVTGAVNAQWAGNESYPMNSGLAAGTTLELTGGFAELTFIRGATVVVQAPAKLTVKSETNLLLLSGKMTANVPGGGFIVSTSSASVKDLGTEFGVGIESDGSTMVDVFEGKVEAASVSDDVVSTKPELLSEGQAAQVTPTAVKRDPNGASFQRFARNLGEHVNAIDLVDIVCGGDGSTHRRDRAIDICTGAAGALHQVNSVAGDHQYHRVSSLPAIDGCFIPDGSKGPVQVDSAGHVFPFAPTDNHTRFLLWAGGAIPPLNKNTGSFSSLLGAVDYATDDHGMLFSHCNKGLTYNLDVIRALHPRRSVARFRCEVGNNCGPQFHSLTDARVIIDGVAKFEKVKFDNKDGPFAIDIPLTDNDHFLTLAATDGGDGTGHDWVIWGDPILELHMK